MRNKKRGQGLAEYGLVSVLCGLVCYLALFSTADRTIGLYNRVAGDIASINDGSFNSPNSGRDLPGMGGGVDVF